MRVTPADQDAPAGDLLRGAREIAGYIGEPERRTIYLLERGVLPAGKLGTRWIASEKRIARFFAELAAGKAA